MVDVTEDIVGGNDQMQLDTNFKSTGKKIKLSQQTFKMYMLSQYYH